MKKLFQNKGTSRLAKAVFGGPGNVKGWPSPARGSGFGRISPIGSLGTPKLKGHWYQVSRQRPQLRGAATAIVGRVNSLKIRRK